MTEPTNTNLNSEPTYYNYAGKFPPLNLGENHAVLPPDSVHTNPKVITDTTLRDGAQDSRFAIFPHAAKLKYYDLLHELDNGTGTIEAIEVFIYQKRDIWVLEKLLERGYEFPEVTTWTRALPKDIRDLVKISGGAIKETGLLASASDHHIFDRLKFRSKAAAIESYLAPIMTAAEHGIRPRVHLEDCTRADIEGWVLPFMRTVMKETDGWARFRVCDTIGWGIPDPRAEAPFGIPQLISRLYQETGAELEFHGHNDFGLATANTISAWLYGCKRANVAFGGLGERTGNTSLEQMVAALVRLWGDPGLELEALADLTRLIDTEVIKTPSKSPIVGDSIFSTQAGLHQTGVARQSEAAGGLIYLAYQPSLVGRTNEEYNQIGSLSGMDGLVAILNGEAQLRGEPARFTTTSRKVKRLYDHVQASYDGQWNEKKGEFTNYRTTFFSPAELYDLTI